MWALALAWTIMELARSQQLGRPLDTQKFEGLKIKHNMDVDEMVYVGDSDVGATGLVNNPAVAPENAAGEWTPDTDPVQILADINAIIEQGWANTGYAVCPSRLLLPPRKYSLLTRPVTAAGSLSILQYLSDQCISNGINGKPLEIMPLKWLTGRGQGETDRAVAYTKNELYLRFPLVPLTHTPVEYRGLSQITTYFGALGEIEFVYPETIIYTDGI
jgi:hypothetical protein